ncbi:MAG: protein arginine kinase [Clostridia bacterium]|nr:protein arginine kinase [Clostridia bacterium]
MDLKDVINRHTSKWMEGSGPHNDIVISSRIRLARNLKEINFPHQLETEDAKKVVTKVEQALSKLDGGGKKEIQQELQFIPVDSSHQLEQQILMERHLISPHFIGQNIPKGFVVNQNDSISIMVNEEDHLRIQCLYPGLQLEKSWETADKVDDYLEKSLDYAYSEELGYLTVCPTNVGTGCRASVMLHLAGLVLTGQLNRFFTTLSQIGLTVRGIYGEGTEAKGNLFQVSNQITLGTNELEIVNNLEAVTRQLVEHENQARQFLLKESGKKLEDRVHRALGILSFARVISSNEAIHLLSDVRLGVDLGLINGIDRKILTELVVLTSAGSLQKNAGTELGSEDRDIRRAAVIRERIGVAGK